MSDAKPYLSLGLMLGDAHVPVLARCLHSVLWRSSGEPLVDEIVIGWNGKDRAAFDAALTFVRRGLKADDTTLHVVPFAWPGRFDDARNVWWPKLQGEWLLWLDADDVVADAGTPEGLAAIEAVERDYGLPPPPPGAPTQGVTLKQLLKSLPPGVNTVLCPYDYTLDENGYCVVRQSMKRLVRRSAGHLWYSPDASGVHELLQTVNVKEESITTLGLLVRHQPTEDAAARSQRNLAIVQSMEKAKPPVGALQGAEPRMAYDIGNASLVAGDVDKAHAAFKSAVENATNDADKYVAQLSLASLQLLQRNQPAEALKEALAAIGLMPELQDAYYVAAECFFRLQKWHGVVEFFERGRTKGNALTALDQPLGKWVPPRLQAALAYAELGQPDKGVELVLEARARYPKNRLALEYGEKVIAEAKKKVGREKLLDTIEWLAEVSPATARALLHGVKQAVAFRDFTTNLKLRYLDAKVSEDADFDLLARSEDGDPSDVLRFRGMGGEPVDGLGIFKVAEVNQKQLLHMEPHEGGYKVRWRQSRGTIVFYCPAAAYTWQPSDVDVHGLGGSEGSVAYLARELARRDYHVVVYASTPLATLWPGERDGRPFAVEQRPVSSFKPDAHPGATLISCRAPWMGREELVGKRAVWCWHQDNGYGNPWMWSPEVARGLKGNLHVSEWAQRGLLRELGGIEASSFGVHHVLGNGVTRECLDGWEPSKRNSKHVVYASDPARGLERLLDAWPEVLKEHPDAILSVACDFRVMLSIRSPEPGIPALAVVQRIKQKLATTPNVNYLGWLPHRDVLQLMKLSGIYCYPGYDMAEGFGVSLAQALACGATVIAPQMGALPEVLGTANVVWGRPEPLSVKDVTFFLKAHLGREGHEGRRIAAEALYEKHGWPTVAKRFLKLVGLP